MKFKKLLLVASGVSLSPIALAAVSCANTAKNSSNNSENNTSPKDVVLADKITTLQGQYSILSYQVIGENNETGIKVQGMMKYLEKFQELFADFYAELKAEFTNEVDWGPELHLQKSFEKLTETSSLKAVSHALTVLKGNAKSNSIDAHFNNLISLLEKKASKKAVNESDYQAKKQAFLDSLNRFVVDLEEFNEHLEAEHEHADHDEENDENHEHASLNLLLEFGEKIHDFLKDDQILNALGNLPANENVSHPLRKKILEKFRFEKVYEMFFAESYQETEWAKSLKELSEHAKKIETF
ncbi:hypothetical protein [Mycoplasma sp. Ms02]|uniref:hypothetical protein n=1 Tax=Mycoplasma sp. Ms02 TaxID=353851 RepID=UPI001C8ABF88|nr:hypothetical protein [Mycoplasma sp. Ms02]QZE12590.1 hypothetical protein K4L35_01220 [Mycoplasma sp. Ms02]